MKEYRIITLLVAVFSFVVFNANAQYDDIYYNPDENQTSNNFQQTDRQQYSYDNEVVSDYNSNYDQYDDETYDYYYTSRIRRFHRPTYGFGYFDPVYTDLYYYDPFLTPFPGRTVLIYDTPYSYSSWARWNYYNRLRFSPFGAFGNRPFGPSFYGSSFALRSTWGTGFGAPFGAFPGNFYGPGFGAGLYTGGLYNGFGGGFYGGSALYCPPTYGGGYNYNTVNNVADNSNSTYGPRSRASSTTAPRTNTPRTDRTNTNTVTSRSGRSVRGSDRATPTRVTPSSDRLRPTTIDRSRINRDRTRGTRSIDRSRSIDRTTRQSPRSRTYTTPRTRSYNPRSTTPRSRSIQRTSPTRRNYTPSRTRSVTPRSSGSSIRRSTPSRSTPSRSSGSRSSSRRGGGGE